MQVQLRTFPFRPAIRMHRISIFVQRNRHNAVLASSSTGKYEMKQCRWKLRRKWVHNRQALQLFKLCATEKLLRKVPSRIFNQHSDCTFLRGLAYRTSATFITFWWRVTAESESMMLRQQRRRLLQTLCMNADRTFRCSMLSRANCQFSSMWKPCHPRTTTCVLSSSLMTRPLCPLHLQWTHGGNETTDITGIPPIRNVRHQKFN